MKDRTGEWRHGRTRMNFCKENKVILRFLSSLPVSFSTISDASIMGELTSLLGREKDVKGGVDEEGLT